MRTIVRVTAVAMVIVGASAAAAAAKSGGEPAVPLTTGQEAEQVTSGASGFFAWTVDGDELCYTLEVRDLTATPLFAHIHLAPRNVAGPIVVPLATPPAATSTVSACITAQEGGAMTPAELAAIVADPRAYYVNVHTPENGPGEVRGQLKG